MASRYRPTFSGTTSYTFNPVQSANRDKLTQETSTRGGGYSFGFAYDNAGNPTTFKGVSRGYNANNQITGTGYSYDGAGNATSYSGIGITWGPEGQPTLFGTSLMSAGYRSDGLRAWKTLGSGTGSKNYFVYDGTVPVLELSADGGVRYYNTFGANGLLSRWYRNSGGSTSTTRFFLWDERGNLANRLTETQAGSDNPPATLPATLRGDCVCLPAPPRRTFRPVRRTSASVHNHRPLSEVGRRNRFQS